MRITPNLLKISQIAAMNQFLKQYVITHCGDITLSWQGANRLALLCQIEKENKNELPRSKRVYSLSR